jgi:hypothetical protein
MVVQINAEANDTVLSAATGAVAVANALGINSLFFWDRVPYEVKPGSNAEILAQTITDAMAAKGKQ